jgi:hypothetical protein
MASLSNFAKCLQMRGEARFESRVFLFFRVFYDILMRNIFHTLRQNVPVENHTRSFCIITAAVSPTGRCSLS